MRRSAVELERESSQTLPARSPNHSIQQIWQVLGVGVVLHGLTDVVEQRAGFRVEASDLLIEIARQQILVHLCVGHISSHHNHLGSGAVVIDRAGNKVETLTYFPYGGTRTDLPGTPVNVPYKYTGQELDSSTGLYDYGARQYEPALGRFTSPDTIVPDPRDPQSLNRYSYAQNNPLRYIDPSGHEELPSDFPTIPVVCFPCGSGGTSPADMQWSQQMNQFQQQYQLSPQSPVLSEAYWGTVGASMYGQGAGQQFLSNYLLGTSLGLEANRREMQWIDRMFAPYEVATDAIAGGTLAGSGLSTVKAIGQEVGAFVKGLRGDDAIDLYRAVNSTELADINSRNSFRNPFGTENKYFATTAEGAASYAKQAYQHGGLLYEGPYSIVGTKLERSLVTDIMRAPLGVDRGIQTLVVPTELLPRLGSPTVLPYAPIPKVP